MTNPSDAIVDSDLVARFMAGDESAFDQLARRHQDRIYRLARVLLPVAEDARDATQEVLLRAYRGLAGWRGEARLTTWLHRIAVNVCHEQRRKRASEGDKRSRFRALVAPLLPRAVAPPAEASSDVVALLDELPRRQREVVVLRVLEEHSTRETAAALGLREGSVKAHLHRALGKLRARLAAGEGRGQPQRITGDETC